MPTARKITAAMNVGTAVFCAFCCGYCLGTDKTTAALFDVFAVALNLFAFGMTLLSLGYPKPQP